MGEGLADHRGKATRRMEGGPFLHKRRPPALGERCAREVRRYFRGSPRAAGEGGRGRFYCWRGLELGEVFGGAFENKGLMARPRLGIEDAEVAGWAGNPRGCAREAWRGTARSSVPDRLEATLFRARPRGPLCWSYRGIAVEHLSARRFDARRRFGRFAILTGPVRSRVVWRPSADLEYVRCATVDGVGDL